MEGRTGANVHVGNEGTFHLCPHIDLLSQEAGGLRGSDLHKNCVELREKTIIRVM